MDAEERWRQYLFRGHSQQELESWAKSLRIFRFVRAYGGHANDGDSLLALARYESEPDLSRFLGVLGISLNVLPPDSPEPVPGKTYPLAEFSTFRSKVPGLEHLEQPERCSVQGAEVFVWVSRGTVRLRIPSGRYDVTEAEVAQARRLEELLVPEASRFIDPPQDDRHCICPRHHPDLFR